MPIAQPSMQMTIASTRNCSRMTPRLAPIALRMPISRVRSVTVTSMMFMIPMPPTISEIAAIPPNNTARTDVTEFIVLSSAFCEEIENASSSLSSRSRSNSSMRALASSVVTPSAAER